MDGVHFVLGSPSMANPSLSLQEQIRGIAAVTN
jgi:hypothetical protein